MKNLAHSASFDSEEKNAPSKLGIKHLGHLKGDHPLPALSRAFKGVRHGQHRSYTPTRISGNSRFLKWQKDFAPFDNFATKYRA
ncbi:hypothetical protein [Mesorhizobium sp. M0977]|uniref:hypothetical protein n=1 Tax=Mesorhizobium sp. M0977 TaxID=2957039 RepID=UPI00333ABFAC